MPDYDVAVTELIVPADPSPLGTFRPAVKVLNLGLHTALVTGDIRLYAAGGAMAFSSGLQQVIVPAGEYRLAYAAGLWTPADVGDYSVLATIGTERDDVLANNTLSGISVTITGAAAPPTAEHGNEAHDPDFISDGDLDAHAVLQANVHGYDEHGDLGIGCVPEDRAILELKATTKAFIPPRMTTLQKNQVLPPSAGMILYDTDLAQLYFYTGAAWEPVAGASDHARQHAVTSASDHTSAATPGQALQADANGLPVDATNTDAEVAAAVVASHARQHAITATDDHTSGATPAQLLQADANGLPVDATNTDAEVANTVLQTTPQTLVDQAAIDWDLALGGAAQVTLGGNRTLNAPTNMVDGARYRLKVIQDGTGTRLLTWNAVYRFPGGVDPCLSAAPGNIDILQFDCDGTHMDCVGMVSALA